MSFGGNYLPLCEQECTLTTGGYVKRLCGLFLLLLLTSIAALADVGVEPPKFKGPIQVLLNAYASGDAESLHKRFSPKLALSLPTTALSETLTRFKVYYGPVDKCQFINAEGNSVFFHFVCKKRPFGVRMSVDDAGAITGFSMGAVHPKVDYPVVPRTITKMSLPFKGRWYVIWGGETLAQNYHARDKHQKDAMDFIMVGPDGLSYKGEGLKNEDYFAFGKEILSPCDATVLEVVDGIRDNAPGETNPAFAPGNCMILRTANNEYILISHFKQNTISVKVGQQLKRGQLLGLCGSSGNAPEPHLHFHIQNIDDIPNATGIKCFFDRIYVTNSDKVEELRTDYSPVRGESVMEAK